MIDVGKKIQYWIKLSESDMATAVVLLEHNRLLDTGFYCHQAIEKILKAYFWHVNKVEPPYTHSLILLAQKVRLYETMQDDFKNLLNKLGPLNVGVRYPDEESQLEKEMDRTAVENIVQQTKEFCEWMAQSLKK